MSTRIRSRVSGSVLEKEKRRKMVKLILCSGRSAFLPAIPTHPETLLTGKQTVKAGYVTSS